MSEFDDVIRDDKTHSTEPQVPEEDTQPKLDKKSLIEMLTDDGDLSEFGKQLNLDSDMTEKVLVPLVNFLDKKNLYSKDTIIGIVAYSFLAIGLILIATFLQSVNLNNYLFGDIIAISKKDII